MILCPKTITHARNIAILLTLKVRYSMIESVRMSGSEPVGSKYTKYFFVKSFCDFRESQYQPSFIDILYFITVLGR